MSPALMLPNAARNHWSQPLSPWLDDPNSQHAAFAVRDGLNPAPSRAIEPESAPTHPTADRNQAHAPNFLQLRPYRSE
jgi:hypothetical protein